MNFIFFFCSRGFLNFLDKFSAALQASNRIKSITIKPGSLRLFTLTFFLTMSPFPSCFCKSIHPATLALLNPILASFFSCDNKGVIVKKIKVRRYQTLPPCINSIQLLYSYLKEKDVRENVTCDVSNTSTQLPTNTISDQGILEYTGTETFTKEQSHCG